MSQKIEKLFIQNLLGKENILWDLSRDVNVLVGRNGAGKSSILNIIKSLISGLGGEDITLDICSKAEIEISSGEKRGFKKVPKDLEASIKMALSLFSKKITSEKNMSDGRRKRKTQLTEDMIQKFESDILKEFFKEIPIASSKVSIEENTYSNGELDGVIEDSLEAKIPFEYISTINMNANSLNEINSSDGRKTTILDMEIEKEISRLRDISECELDSNDLSKVCKSKDIKNRLINTVNEMLIESDKEMQFTDEISFTTSDNKTLKLSQLSSGERQLVYTLIKSAIAAHSDAILLMDEPEISLHPSWQEVLISKIRDVNPNGQIIIVTHSPAIVMNGWMSTFIDIEDIKTQESKGIM